MRVLHILAACVVAVLASGAEPAGAVVLIKINKTIQRMSVSVDGETRYTWAVSTGLPGYNTPGGSYTPFRLEEDYFSKEWDDAPMPHSIFFTGRGHAIHGSDATRRLGSPASHGCIRLSRANAATLFDLVSREGLSNTRVQVSGDETIALARRAAHVRTAARTSQTTAARRGLRDPRGDAPLASGSIQPYYVPGQPVYVPYYDGW
jgi:L,D-transpeptidase catalytic domain